MKVEISRCEARLRSPFASASSRWTSRPLILLGLEDDDGACGYGEAAPLRDYDGFTITGVHAALERCRPLLEGSSGEDRDLLLRRCAASGCPTPALSAIDLALWDLAGRRAGAPVWQLLGATATMPVAVNATIASAATEEAAADAARAARAGFRVLKVKVGAGSAARIAAIRDAAGTEVELRIDANGGWSIDQALAALEQLEPLRIECCEEPVHGLAAIEEVARLVRVPVSLDETANAPEALRRRVCSAICLKVSRCGGLSGLMRTASAARAAGYEIYLASSLDGPLGIAAGLHAAVVLAPERACGLATLGLIADRPDPLPARAGAITPDDSPGLGVTLADWYAS